MSRSQTHEIEIDVAPDDVWKALSEGEGLAKWFAVSAEVEPGVGGCWKVSWDESPPAMLARIEEWQPGLRLRLRHEQERGGETVVLIDEFEIVALDGGARTRLRLVVSGFGDDASWDDEFEGTKNGWAVFLRNLRYALERHPGAPCHSAGTAVMGVALPKAEAFERIFGAGGLLAIAGGLEDLDEGRAVVIEPSFGGRFEGRVDFARPPALLGLELDGLGLLRAEFVGSEGLYIHLMVLAYGEGAKARVEPLVGPLAEGLRSRLGLEEQP